MKDYTTTKIMFIAFALLSDSISEAESPTDNSDFQLNGHISHNSTLCHKGYSGRKHIFMTLYT